jgi:hypothetical protein
MTLVNVGYAIALAYLNEVLVEHFVGKPLEEKFPHIDRWWLIYVALATGGVITWFVGLNIFADLMPGLLGQILTCVIVGGGSELLHRIIELLGDLATKWASPYR